MIDDPEFALSPPLAALPRAVSMDVSNDPRFFTESVIAKRLVAFQTIVVVAVLMVNLSVKQMFTLKKSIDISTAHGVVQYSGFVLMTTVFLLNLTTVIVLIQQLFQTYRLLTVGPTGFEIAKSYYLNPNIVTMRHMAVKGFFFSLPAFVASSSCMVFVSFSATHEEKLSIAVVAMLLIASMLLVFVNMKHTTIFKHTYALARSHQEPLLSHVETVSQSNRSMGGWFMGLDV